MTTEQSIAVGYFIELMEKHRVRALVIQKGEHIYGVVKAKHEALEVPFNADRLSWVSERNATDVGKAICVDVLTCLKELLVAKANRDYKYFSRLAQQLQDDLDQFFGFSKLGDEEVLWKGNH
ncbi:hypothetical protein E2P74_09885 [Limosilactobacillus fermentum]|uniref:hypothetical protein n=1 Tax=Limosilactobacillus fermentum TaxID=1613 RepID=UPI001075C59D|nr:hypothetical protein [Limosilactobacillus fermentum]TFZ15387.1 hypothetical protein E2P74_09885 [Limosilactobacillus fermentum]